MLLPAEQRYTYADALTWVEGTRVELIEGYPCLMAPAPRRVHQAIVSFLNWKLYDYLDGKTCAVYVAPFDVRLFEAEGDRPEDVDTVVQPDVCVVCDPAKLDDAGCKGAPDLIVEVLSASSRRHDRVTKFDLYQRAGVREYWIVDPDTRYVLVHTLEEGRYHSPAVYPAGTPVPVGVLEDCVIDLSSVWED